MAENKIRFLVVFFSKNKRLLMGMAILALLVAAVWLIVSFTNWLVAVDANELPWTVLYEDEDWHGTAINKDLPRFFVAGGTSYDKQVLVDGWGMSANVLNAVNYLEDLGMHVLMGEVTSMDYGDGTLRVMVEERPAGYMLVTVSKEHFQQGDLEIVFVDGQGVPIGTEEEFIYSVPLEYSVVNSGAAETKDTSFIELVDQQTLPALAGVDVSLENYLDHFVLYIQGGEVSSIQRHDQTVRIYVDKQPVYQVIALPRSVLSAGENIVRLIDDNDLSVKSEINLSISN